MKKITSLTSAVAFMLAATSVFTSCQSDDDFGNAVVGQQAEGKCTDLDEFLEELNDSNEYTPFEYNNLGPVSATSQVNDPDNIASLVGSDVISRGGDKGMTFSGFLKWGAGSLGGSALKYAGTAIGKQIIKAIGIEMDPYVKKLGDISNGIDNINKTMEEMNGKLDAISAQLNEGRERQENVEMTTLFRERYEKFAPLNLSTCRYFINFMSDVKNGNEQGATDEAEKWVNSMSNGNNNYQALLNYMDYMSGVTNTNTKGFNMPQVYDYWVYQTTPWEHEGYAKREALRMADITTVFAGTIMAKVYFASGKEASGDYMLKEIDRHLDKFIKSYESNPVTRHDDKRICQIRGAHFIAEHNFFTFNPEMALSNASSQTTTSNIKWAMRIDDNYKKNYFSEAELMAICNYYGFTNLKQLEDKFAELGFDMSSFDKSKAHAMNLEASVKIKGLPESAADLLQCIFYNKDKVASFQFNKVVSDKDDNLTPKEFNLGYVGYRCDKEHRGAWYGAWSQYNNDRDIEFYNLNIDRHYTDMYPLGK